MGVASMVAGAKAAAAVVDRWVKAAPDGGKLMDFPPLVDGHAGISDDRCRALRGGGGGGVLLLIQLI